MKQIRALGGAVLLAAVVLLVPAGASAQTPTCNLTNPPCGGAPACNAPCAGPTVVSHSSYGPCDPTAAASGGGDFNLKGTEFENTCCNFFGPCTATVKVPPIRFWAFGGYAKGNSGCGGPTPGASGIPEDGWICNGKLDIPGGPGPDNGHWFLFQASWGFPNTDGCYDKVVPPATRTVAEISFVDTPSEGTVNHKSWYLVASAQDTGAGYNFDTVTGAGTCGGRTSANSIAIQPVPGISIDARTAGCTGAGTTRTNLPSTAKNAVDPTGHFDVAVTLANTSPDFYDETGKSKATNQLIAGLQIVYSKQAVGVEPMSSDPFSATAGWKPVRDPSAPVTKALGVVAWGAAAKVNVSLPQGAATDDYYLATRIVYADPLSPAGTFDPATAGPIVTSKMSGHCGPVSFGGTLAVEFDKVNAVRTANGVQVSWTTVSEDDTLGFVVRRTEPSKGEAGMTTVGSAVEANGGTRPYNLEDTKADAHTTYLYYVQELTPQGYGSRSAAIRVEGLAQPAQSGVSGGRGRSSRRSH